MGKEKFFRSIKKTIQKEFTLKEENKVRIRELLEKMKKENSVSIHIRRGDLLTLKGAYIVPLEYYKKAIALIKKKVRNPQFYVFSDDDKWCKENLSDLGVKMNFVENMEGFEVLELMRCCKHNILAVSALSWWAAYLNENKKRIVIAPKHFSHFVHADKDEEYLPRSWVRL